MKENITKNIIFTFVITTCSTVLSFVINKYILDFFGEENLGLFRLLSQVVFYLTLLDLGISTSATVAYYKPLMENNIRKLSKIYSTINAFYNKVALLTAVIGIISIPALTYMVNYESKLMLAMYWMIFVFNTVITFIANKYVILFLADQRVFYVKAVTGLSIFFEKLTQIYILFEFRSFLLFLSISIIISLFKLYLFKKKMNATYSKIEIVSERDFNVKSDAGNMFFHKLSHIVLYNTDNIIIVKFISLSVVAAYSSYLMLVSIIMTIVSIFHSVVDPIIGHIIVKQNGYENYQLWVVLFKFSFWISSLSSLGFYYFSTPFITNWLGDKLTLDQTVVLLVIVNLFFDIIKWPTELVKYKYSYFKDIYNPIIEVILNIGLSIALVKVYGINGVILGTVIVNIVSNVIIKPIIVFRYCLSVSMFLFFRQLASSVLEMSCIILIVNYILSFFVKIDLYVGKSWYGFIESLTIFIFLYLIVWFCVIKVFKSHSTLISFIYFIQKKEFKHDKGFNNNTHIQ